MIRNSSSLIGIIAVSLAVVGGMAAAQDKYTVQVPNGLAFSEFRGFEDWTTVSVSTTTVPQVGNLIEVILANPVMINAYRSGIPCTRSRCGRGGEVRRACIVAGARDDHCLAEGALVPGARSWRQTPGCVGGCRLVQSDVRRERLRNADVGDD